jgi:hypothetical protein
MLDKFTHVAKFVQLNEEVQCVVNEDVDKYERVSLVYMMVVDNTIKYIGKTIQGLRRPLTYHKNLVMEDVNKGITEHCSSGKVVDVYCRRFDVPLQFEDLDLDICEAYEQALISKFKPEWNNHIR